MAAILAGAALGLVVDQAAGHMKLMNQRQAGCVDPDALRHVRPQYAGVEAARRDLDRFHRWCDRENTLDEHVQGINNVALTYAPGVGLSLDAARDIDADATVFRVPPGMVLSGELSVVKETMADRLSAEQLEMLELASKLSQAELHRDLSVRVCDFGLSREFWHTHAMSRVGTLQWAAPEVLLGQPYSHKCDAWSFGVVAWELLTALMPFDGMSRADLARKVAVEGLRLPPPPGSPMPLLQMMARCWSTKPRQRPEMRAMHKELQEALQALMAQAASGA